MKKLVLNRIDELIAASSEILLKNESNSQKFTEGYHEWNFKWENLVTAIYKKQSERVLRNFKEKVHQDNKMYQLNLKISFLKATKSDLRAGILDLQDVSKRWKVDLRSLSLEHESAKILTSNDFRVISDYNPRAPESSSVSSIDIQAITFPKNMRLNLTYLIECKYRHPKTMWVFLPDPNPSYWVSPLRDIWGVFRIVTDFTDYPEITPTVFKQFEKIIPKCYKGIELRPKKGQEESIELQHGIKQLQYALPSILSDFMGLNYRYEYEKSFIFCPILLTTADLYVTSTDFSIKQVQNMKEKEDVGEKVPYLILSSNYDSTFEIHCINKFTTLYSHVKNDIDEFEKHCKPWEKPPKEFLLGFINGAKYQLINYFTKFLICNVNEFENLIIKITNILRKYHSERTKHYKNEVSRINRELEKL